jgi:hypothetical protein
VAQAWLTQQQAARSKQVDQQDKLISKLLMYHVKNE